MTSPFVNCYDDKLYFSITNMTFSFFCTCIFKFALLASCAGLGGLLANEFKIFYENNSFFGGNSLLKKEGLENRLSESNKKALVANQQKAEIEESFLNEKLERPTYKNSELANGSYEAILRAKRLSEGIKEILEKNKLNKAGNILSQPSQGNDSPLKEAVAEVGKNQKEMVTAGDLVKLNKREGSKNADGKEKAKNGKRSKEKGKATDKK